MVAPGWLARGQHQLPAGDRWLSRAEAARAAGMGFSKRRAEYLTRRWAGKLAVADRLGLGADPAALALIELRNAASGAPVPYLDGRRAGLELSLTDRAGWAVCLVWPGPQPIGCDLELVEPRTPAFVRDYLTAVERRTVAAAGWDAGRRVAANLIWSAKESTLKLLRTGLGRDTRSVEITLSTVDPEGWSELTARTEEGGRLPGWCRRHGPFLTHRRLPGARPPAGVH